MAPSSSALASPTADGPEAAGAAPGLVATGLVATRLAATPLAATPPRGRPEPAKIKAWADSPSQLIRCRAASIADSCAFSVEVSVAEIVTGVPVSEVLAALETPGSTYSASRPP